MDVVVKLLFAGWGVSGCRNGSRDQRGVVRLVDFNLRLNNWWLKVSESLDKSKLNSQICQCIRNFETYEYIEISI
jgi:hypothetical protein